MRKSLQAFMKGIIDYAGLFPPAKLPLDEAIHNYARYKKSSDEWMLDRFIIPAAKLGDLSPYAGKLFTEDLPFHFSVLGSAAETVENFHNEINKLWKECNRFIDKYERMAKTPAAEIKLPKEATASQNTDLLKQLMDKASEQLRRSSRSPNVIFYENLLGTSWKKEIEATVQAIAEHNRKIVDKATHYSLAGYKLRCGGVEAHLFPSVEQVAFVINKARNYGIPVKGTAGLHHPVRHFAPSVQTKMHGFLNVFGGAMLSHAHDLSQNELQKILSEEDPDRFSFSEESFQWKDLSIPTEEISQLRTESLLSYGSCSFDEPREGLRQLDML